jgi:hypothetical protein
MEKNVGNLDRTARLVLGPVLMAAGVFAPVDNWLRITLGVIGVALLLTGSFSF